MRIQTGRRNEYIANLDQRDLRGLSAMPPTSASHYGIRPEAWSAAKREARSIMIERAKVRGMIPYSELVKSIRAVRFEPHDIRLFDLIGQISTDEDAAGRGMLSVVVVHKTGDMQPGPGFFELAQSLGRDTRDLLACWVAELHKVHAVWMRSNPS